MNINVKNIVERLLWTAIQAAFGSISVVSATAAVTGGHVSALRTIGLTALGAGVAAALSLAKNLTSELVVVQSATRQQAVTQVAAPLAPYGTITNAGGTIALSPPTFEWTAPFATGGYVPKMGKEPVSSGNTDSTYASSIAPEAAPSPAKRAAKKAAGK